MIDCLSFSSVSFVQRRQRYVSRVLFPSRFFLLASAPKHPTDGRRSDIRLETTADIVHCPRRLASTLSFPYSFAQSFPCGENWWSILPDFPTFSICVPQVSSSHIIIESITSLSSKTSLCCKFKPYPQKQKSLYIGWWPIRKVHFSQLFKKRITTLTSFFSILPSHPTSLLHTITALPDRFKPQPSQSYSSAGKVLT